MDHPKVLYYPEMMEATKVMNSRPGLKEELSRLTFYQELVL